MRGVTNLFNLLLAVVEIASEIVYVDNNQVSVVEVKPKQEKDFAGVDEPSAGDILDPISAIMENVMIVDVTNFIPKEYSFEAGQSESNRDKDTSFKPGKLFGKRLSAVANKLKNAKVPEETKDSKEDEFNYKPGKLFGKKLAAVASKINEAKATERASTKKVNELGNSLLDEATLSVSTTTPPVSTRSDSVSASPIICTNYCSVSGRIFINSGLNWSHQLLNPQSALYREVTDDVEKEIGRIFKDADFGRTEFAVVESYSKMGPEIIVDIYLQFDGLSSIDIKDIKSTFSNYLYDNNSQKSKLGKFGININSTYFFIVNTSKPLVELKYEEFDVNLLPDWAWLVVLVGIVSTFIIAFLGVTMGVRKYRADKRVKKSVLDPRTLKQFRRKTHFDEADVDFVTSYKTNKRDMWTIQKNQQKSKKSKASFGKKMKLSDQAMGGKGKLAVGHISLNDSNAALISSGNDGTTLNDSRDCIDDASVNGKYNSGEQVFKSTMLKKVGTQVLPASELEFVI